MSTAPASPLLTVSEVAEMCNVAEVTVRRWISDGHLPVIRLGRVVRVDPGDLAKWIESGRSESAPRRVAPRKLSVVRPLPKRKRTYTR